MSDVIPVVIQCHKNGEFDEIPVDTPVHGFLGLKISVANFSQPLSLHFANGDLIIRTQSERLAVIPEAGNSIALRGVK